MDRVFLQKTKSLIINSLALVAALAWDNAFQKFFENTPILKNTGPWIYALLVTIIMIVLTFVLNPNDNIKDNQN